MAQALALKAGTQAPLPVQGACRTCIKFPMDGVCLAPEGWVAAGGLAVDFRFAFPGFLCLIRPQNIPWIAAARPAAQFIRQNKRRRPILRPLVMSEKSSQTAVKYPAGGGAAVPITLGVLAAVLGISLLAWMVNRNILVQQDSVTSFSIVLGLLLSTLQTFSVCTSLNIRWVPPLDAMFRGISIVALNIGVTFNAGCLVGASPAVIFSVRQMLAPGCAVIVLIVVALKKVMRSQDTQYWVESINAVGTIYSMLFVSMVMSALQPWVCYDHPNQNGFSMLDSPGVLCFDSSEHTSMVTLGLIVILVIILPFVALVFWANLRYPVSVRRGRSDAHIRTFRFLFFRYHAHYYLFSVVTLLRGLFVCLVAVVARGSPEVQTLLMGAVLLSYGGFVLRIGPWRGSHTNSIDGTLTLVMVAVLMCAAMTTTFENADSAIGYLGMTACIMVFWVTEGSLAGFFFRRLRP